MPFPISLKHLFMLLCLVTSPVAVIVPVAAEIAPPETTTVENRVRLVPEQELRGYVPDQPFVFHFSLTAASLPQRLILTLANPVALAKVEVRLNGVQQFFQAPPDAHAVSFALTQSQVGDNLLEVILHHPSHAQVFLDGYADPGSPALISAEQWQASQRAEPAALLSGAIQLVFLPGMAIQLRPQGSGFVFRDANGTSLTRLNHTLKHLRVTASTELSSRSEVDSFILQVDPSLNLWAVIDQLQSLPYFVQVRPAPGAGQARR